MGAVRLYQTSAQPQNSSQSPSHANILKHTILSLQTICPHTDKLFSQLSRPLDHREDTLAAWVDRLTGLTCLQQHLSAVQVLHFVAVVLGVRGAGARRSGLGPVHFCKTLSVKLQGVYPTLPGQLQHHPPGHNIPTAVHRRTVHLRRVEDYVKLFQLVENHFCRFCDSSLFSNEKKWEIPLLFLRSVFKGCWEWLSRLLPPTLVCSKARYDVHFRTAAFLQAEKVGGVYGSLCKASGEGLKAGRCCLQELLLGADPSGCCCCK